MTGENQMWFLSKKNPYCSCSDPSETWLKKKKKTQDTWQKKNLLNSFDIILRAWRVCYIFLLNNIDTEMENSLSIKNHQSEKIFTREQLIPENGGQKRLT